MRRLVVELVTMTLLPLAGCHHRQTLVVVPPVAPPEIRPVMVSVPPPTHPTEPWPKPDVAVVQVPVATPPPPKKPRRKKVAPAPAPALPPVVATAVPPAIELGQLSAGDSTGNNLRGETEQMLLTQKQRIDRLPAPVVAAHFADIEQARRFLKGAEDAWKVTDIEGAHTLVVKAKVLVDDLPK